MSRKRDEGVSKVALEVRKGNVFAQARNSTLVGASIRTNAVILSGCRKPDDDPFAEVLLEVSGR